MRQEPSSAVDKLWEAYETLDIFPITRDDVIALGMDPNLAVQLKDDDFGLGQDKYMAAFDGIHKIHCLNELRKMTFADYGDRSPKKKRHGKLWWIHLRHCVDMLMQDHLCHADADIITYYWVDTQNHPWPNLGVNKRCRSWDQIAGWGQSRYVDQQKVERMRRPEDAVVLPFEYGYYDMYGFNDSEMFPNGSGYKLEMSSWWE